MRFVNSSYQTFHSFIYSSNVKRKQREKSIEYTHQQMNLAVNAVRDDGLTIYKAAKIYGVPRSSLWKRFVSIKQKIDRTTAHSIEKESKLAQ